MDSGTTLLRLPQKVFDAVVEAVARASLVSPQVPGGVPEHGCVSSLWTVIRWSEDFKEQLFCKLLLMKLPFDVNLSINDTFTSTSEGLVLSVQYFQCFNK